MSETYNKNAREKELLEEAYGNVYTEADESRAERADVDRYEYEQGKEAAYDSEADAYRDMSDGYKAADSVKVGNIYKGESYYELVVGIKGDNVFTKRIDIKDGNQYDINQMHKELSHAGNIDFEVLNEIL